MPGDLIIPRAAWGAPPVSLPSIPRPAPWIAAHYIGGGDVYGGVNASQATEGAFLRGIRSFHLGQGKSDIAYSFGVAPSGRLYELRGWGRYGGHTGNQDGNRKAHAILFMGTALPLSDAVIDAIVWLIDEGQRLGHVADPAQWIFGHRDVGAYGYGPGSTSCPGDNYYSHLPEIRRRDKEGEDDMALFEDREDFQREVRKALGGHVQGTPKLTQDEIKRSIEFSAGEDMYEAGEARPSEEGPKQRGWDRAKKLDAA